jgi:hypothetical protein
MQNPYKRIKVSNQEEEFIVSKIMNFSNYIKESYDKIYLKREESLASIKHFYE